MEQKFNVNDIVRLISGSPDMVVVGYQIRNTGALINVIKKHGGMKQDSPEIETQTVVCTWFDGKKQNSGEFDQGALELVRAAN